MPTDPTDALTESAVVLQLTGRTSGLPRQDLYSALRELPLDRVTAALDSLAALEVIHTTDQTVYASEALKRIDALGLICI